MPGPTGAVKTPTIRTPARLTGPYPGQATVPGHDVRTDPHAVRARISLTSQFATLDASLTDMETVLASDGAEPPGGAAAGRRAAGRVRAGGCRRAGPAGGAGRQAAMSLQLSPLRSGQILLGAETRARHRRHRPPRVRRPLVADPCRWRLHPPRNAPRHRPRRRTTQAGSLTGPPSHDAGN